jgi:hypothetical protein
LPLHSRWKPSTGRDRCWRGQICLSVFVCLLPVSCYRDVFDSPRVGLGRDNEILDQQRPEDLTTPNQRLSVKHEPCTCAIDISALPCLSVRQCYSNCPRWTLAASPNNERLDLSPCGLVPLSCPNRTCRATRSPGMRMTWPSRRWRIVGKVGSPPVTLRGLMRKDVLLLNGGGGQVHCR